MDRSNQKKEMVMSLDLKPPYFTHTIREMFAVTDMLGTPGTMLRASRPGSKTERRLPVIVLPGLGANDFSTAPLRYFLQRQGYQTEGWGLGFNTGGRGIIDDLDELSDRWDIDRTRNHNGEGQVPALCDKMAERVLARAQALNSPVILVGWSLGGVVAREVARDLPDHVAAVVTMGSPVRGGPKYTSVAPLYRAQKIDMDWIENEIDKRHETPITQPITAIYSKRDGIVGWQAALDTQSPNVENVEVDVSHMGLGLNAKVWNIVLDALNSADASAIS